ncbi:MAG: peptidylprolyl isomerase [Acidobacteriota bacterium]|nr:MAG: peptidylprolyl isomerase [Acidobacteriota bacterium]
MTGTAVLRLLVSFLLLGILACGSPQQGVSQGEELESDEIDERANEPAPGLLIPALAREQAPESFRVEFQTTKGSFVIEAVREWAPNGVDRFYNLVKVGFFSDVAFYRVVEGFIAQFGVHGDPEINALWAEATFPDDGAGQSNLRGTVSFAQGGPNSRTTQLFVNLVDSPILDETGFVPIGRVIEGMENIDRIYAGYGEPGPKKGKGPIPTLLNKSGNSYLRKLFPEMDYIETAVLVQ